MTFQKALREAEKTGCLFFRRVPHEQKDIRRDILREYSDRRIGKTVGHLWALSYARKPESYYWSPGAVSYLGPYKIKGHWHHDGSDAHLEDFCAKDWRTFPLTKWFLFDQPNVWNPLKVPHRWDPGGEPDWIPGWQGDAGSAG